MSDVAVKVPRATLADYERFVAGRPDDERWELIDGVIEMMTNPTENHGQIAGNLYTAMRPSRELWLRLGRAVRRGFCLKGDRGSCNFTMR